MPTVAARLSESFRARRMRLFLDHFALTSATRVLDVGGNPGIWSTVPSGVRPRITYLNLPRASEPNDDRTNLVFGDGCRLPFASQSFDIAFSNSVIEHVGGPDAQGQFAAEICRVSRAYWVQTPNRLFPVEQHLLTPFIHWLPRSWQRVVVPRATLWGWTSKVGSDQQNFYFDHYLDDIRLLTADELVALFPGSRLLRERFLGWTKSLIVMK